MVKEKKIDYTYLRALTDEQEQELIDAYRSGVPLKELTDRYNIGHDTIYNALRRMHLKPKAGKLTKAQKESIIKDFTEDNIPAKELIQKYKVSYPTIYAVLNKGGAMRRQEIKIEKYPHFVEDLKSELTVYEICQKNGFGEGAYYKLMAQLGIKSRVEFRGDVAAREERNQAILKDLETDMTIKEICIKHNISASQYYRLLIKYGIKDREEYKKSAKRSVK